MAKPACVPKSERDTIAERQGLEAEERALAEAEKRKLEHRKVETRQIVVDKIEDEENEKNMELEANVVVDDDDDKVNEAEEYEAWKVREIARIKREAMIELCKVGSDSHTVGRKAGVDDDGTTYVEFGHLSERFYDSDSIDKVIEVYKIDMQICYPDPNSPECGLVLELVDLLGIIEGTEAEAIEVRKLLWEHIADERSLLMAIVAADLRSDIASDSSVKMCREVDPTGSRTIGVVTKLDLVDAGDARVAPYLSGGKDVFLGHYFGFSDRLTSQVLL
ncbi:hypothetical protein CCACVL1_25386 [Corchorus capsularis]|uniref:Dynamin GTPase domain-containing protein n=1 Tax=Corchorus capsularis TaxID=210143 RepID=A0A1R3GKU9_COCAP|nr:hypothetical protein CCACVL1_25386 [Corchorus capsularis]